MASILKRTRKDGTSSYLVQIRIRGCPTQSATFDRRKDAVRWAAQTEAAISEGRFFKTAKAQKHTLGDLVDRYIETVLPQKPRSQQKQTKQLQWWKEQIGLYPLSDITPALIAQQRDSLAGGVTYRGTQRSPGTVVRYLAALSHAYTIAVREWGWVDENPVRKVSRPREPRGRVRFLSDEERRRLVEACLETSVPALHPIVVMALYTGMRQNEILTLTWSDVDLGRARVLLEYTKNDERRQVPLPRPALEVLQDWSNARRSDSHMVFPSPSNPDKPVYFRAAWESAVKQSNLVDFLFHDLRHTAASYLAMSGASLAEIAEILGHKTLAMVKRYAHLTHSHTAGVMERMAEKFST